MQDWDIIDKQSYRFAKARPDRMQNAVPNDLKPVVAYLHEEHRMNIEAVYLENPQFPEVAVIMDGPLPLAAIETRFSEVLDLRVGPGVVFSAVNYASVLGREAA